MDPPLSVFSSLRLSPIYNFEGCLVSNPGCCCSKRLRYQLNHPSSSLSHPSPFLSHPSHLLGHPSPLLSHPYPLLGHPSRLLRFPFFPFSHLLLFELLFHFLLSLICSSHHPSPLLHSHLLSAHIIILWMFSCLLPPPPPSASDPPKNITFTKSIRSLFHLER